MSSYENLSNLDLGSIEHGILVESVYDALKTRTLKLYIPKIMSLGNYGTSTSSIYISNNIILNDSSCFKKKPTRVYVRNYIEVPIADSAFRGPYRVITTNKRDHLPLYKGEKIGLIIPNNNIKEIRATDWKV